MNFVQNHNTVDKTTAINWNVTTRVRTRWQLRWIDVRRKSRWLADLLDVQRYRGGYLAFLTCRKTTAGQLGCTNVQTKPRRNLVSTSLRTIPQRPANLALTFVDKTTHASLSTLMIGNTTTASLFATTWRQRSHQITICSDTRTRSWHHVSLRSHADKSRRLACPDWQAWWLDFVCASMWTRMSRIACL
jgi:hypothetical protein